MQKEPTFKIEAQSFFDAALAIQAGVLNGYVIDSQDVKCFPQQFGHFFFLTMVLPEPEPVVAEPVVEPAVAEAEPVVAEPAVQPTRKSRKAKVEEEPAVVAAEPAVETKVEPEAPAAE